MWSKAELDSAVRSYSEAVPILERYRDWMELTAILVERDVIEESLDAGVSLSEEQRRLVRDADACLLETSASLVRRFPEAFTERGAPIGSWWWRLGDQITPHAPAGIAVGQPRPVQGT